jgi:hypothetical protein
VQYPGFHAFVAYPRRDSSNVTDVTHKFMMSLRCHQMSPRHLVPEAFQEHKPNYLKTPRRRCQVGVMHACCLPVQYTATHHSGSTQDWELSHGQTSIPECHVHPFQWRNVSIRKLWHDHIGLPRLYLITKDGTWATCRNAVATSTKVWSWMGASKIFLLSSQLD